MGYSTAGEEQSGAGRPASDMINNAFPDALPTQFRLHWYVLERVLGQGGFGITYLARDTNLDQPVAIKEYLPVDVATRRPDATVRARTDEQHERYRGGLERFIREARTLARFDHPNIVRVHSVFEFNDTAYMVMRFEEGETLAALLERRHVLAEAELTRVLMPILDGLELVHKAGFIHRDIKPDNILIRNDGSSVLLDFGSARHASGQARTVTILVAPGYAPFEQYYSAGESQGPWTDIYGLAATCYRAIAGRAPLDAIARSKGILGSTKELMLPASVAGSGRYSPHLLKAIDHALEFSEADRPQSLAEWRRELLGDAPPALALPASAAAVHTRRRSPVLWAAGGAAAALAALAVLPWLTSVQHEPLPATTPAPDAADALRERLAALEQKLEADRRRLAAELERADADRIRVEDERRRLEEERLRAAERKAPPVREAVKPRPRPAVAAVVAVEPPAPAVVEPPAAPLQPPPTVKVATVLEPTRVEPAKPAVVDDPLTKADLAYARGSYADAISVLQPLAERNNAKAQVRLGRLYLEGHGVERSDAEALRLFRRAAEQGDGEARLKLGDMYAAGRGVPQNNFQAYVWYGAAARAGNVTAKLQQERVGATMQPMELRQAGKLIDKLAATQQER